MVVRALAVVALALLATAVFRQEVPLTVRLDRTRELLVRSRAAMEAPAVLVAVTQVPRHRQQERREPQARHQSPFNWSRRQQ
jgi:hypothetical protein